MEKPSFRALSPTNARAQPFSPRARHAGGKPSPADLVGQAVRLRGLPQASPHVCKGVAYCSQDCQVCVASHAACALSRPLAQVTGNHGQAHHDSMHALATEALVRMLMLAQGCPSSRLLFKRVWHVCAASLTRSLSHSLPHHTAPSHHKLTHKNVSHPKHQTLNPKPQTLHCKAGTLNPKP